MGISNKSKGVSKNFKGVTRNLQGSIKDVFRVYQEVLKGASKQFQRCFNKFQSVTQGRFIGVSRKS